MLLTVEEILAADDRVPEIVEVPEWGGEVEVFPLTAEQMEEMEDWWEDNPSGDGYRWRLLSLALANLKFSPEQLEQLEQKSIAPIRRLVQVANRLNDPDEAIRRHAGNSEAAERGGSGSD